MLENIEEYFGHYGRNFDKAARFANFKAHQEPGEDRYFSGHHEMTALYYAYDLKNVAVSPVNTFSKAVQDYINHPFSMLKSTTLGQFSSMHADLTERFTNTYQKPEFGIKSVKSATGVIYHIEEEIIDKKPFCQLRHFKRTGRVVEAGKRPKECAADFPKVLIVAPYSGHYATLLRDTVGAMLQDHDVYITDWANGRDISITQGEFTLEDYITYIMDFYTKIDGDIHVMAVCQPAVPVLAATALMAEKKDPNKPKSLTLMGGPIDARVNPSKINIMSRDKDLDWFDQKVVSYVPHYYKGAFRRVIPGFAMLAGFMNLNLETHVKAPHKLFDHLIRGDNDSAEAHKKFYDEYRAVLDLPADYFLDSVSNVFRNFSLPKGEFLYKGHKVDTKAICKTAIMTVEGEKDDISSPGQTYAAHGICPNIPDDKRAHHLQPKVGHYGVFNGRRWRQYTMPKIREFIALHR